MNLEITFEIAEIICKMEEVCWSEGIGPDNSNLMNDIFKTYPELKEKYSCIIPTIEV